MPELDAFEEWFEGAHGKSFLCTFRSIRFRGAGCRLLSRPNFMNGWAQWCASKVNSRCSCPYRDPRGSRHSPLMPAFARILLPVALIISIVGVAAGYLLIARPAAGVFATHPEAAPIRASEAPKNEAGSSATWEQEFSVMDASWKRWHSPTDL
jgi:hypothetical protein